MRSVENILFIKTTIFFALTRVGLADTNKGYFSEMQFEEKLEMSDVLKTKKKININTLEILERMRVAAGLETLVELAHYLELSPQALGSAKVRGSISLAVLMLFAEKSGLSMDYILHGKKTDFLVLPSALDNNADDIPVGIDREFLERSLRLSPAFARSFIDPGDGSFAIVDTTHNGREISDGEYLIRVGTMAIVRKCRKKITGAIWIEGEDTELPADQIASLDIVGRIAWRGKTC